MTSLPAGAELAVALAALLVALGTIHRYVWPAIKAIGRGVQGMYRLYIATQRFVHDWFGDEGQPSITVRIGRMEDQLRPNGGGSLRDAVDRAAREARQAAGEARTAATEAGRVGRITESLQQGVEDLRHDQSAQGQRITDHRRRNDEQIQALREYLESERDDLLLAKQGLEASITELLMVEGHEPRLHVHKVLPDGPPDTSGPVPPAP